MRDDSGTLTAVFFNQRFLRDVFHRRQQVALFGKVELTGHGVQMQSPQYEILADAPGRDARVARGARPIAGRIRVRDAASRPHRPDLRTRRLPDRQGPAHPRGPGARADLKDGGSSADDIDPIPAEVRAKLHLPARVQAFKDAHFPDDETTTSSC